LGGQNELGIVCQAFSCAVKSENAQTDFWTDIPSMAALQNLLHVPTYFEVIEVIPVKANYKTEDREIVIYHNLGEVASSPDPLSLPMA
jgi:hypothetical protein